MAALADRHQRQHLSHALARACAAWLGERDGGHGRGLGHHYEPRGDRYELEDTVETLCLSGGGLARIRLDMLSDRPHNMTWYAQGTDEAYERGEAAMSAGMAALAFAGEGRVGAAEDLAGEFLPEEWLNPPEGAAGGARWQGLLESRLVDAIATRATADRHPRAMDMTLPGLASQQSIAEESWWRWRIRGHGRARAALWGGCEKIGRVAALHSLMW